MARDKIHIDLVLNTKGFRPLGRINGQLGEFEKSLDASNARVLAFGASAGAILAVKKAFTATVKAAIEVEKSLKDINVILGATSAGLRKFGSDLFEIASKTGQAFQVAATAATELARQGLGTEETLKRTRDALILARLAGMDAAEAVNALTAAINTFNKAGLDSTTIINKLANVDAAFAVSSDDLAKAIGRVGASAKSAGVNFDQLLAIVTTVQQKTARGGAVIGNSFKTIFTRIQRPRVIKELENLGIAIRGVEGEVLPAMKVLQNLARQFDHLTQSQKAQVTEMIGGVFQVNILKAAMSDLSKETGIYNRALGVSLGSSDQALRRNEELNKTLSAQFQKTVNTFKEGAAELGELTLGPALERMFGFVDDMSKLGESDFGKVGVAIAKSIFEGLGKFISGPGLLVIGLVLFKTFSQLGKFAADAFKTLTGLNKSLQTQQSLQRQVFDVLSENPDLLKKIKDGTMTVEEAHEEIFKQIEKNTGALDAQLLVSQQLAKSLMTGGVGFSSDFGATSGKKPRKFGSAGYVPNFAADRGEVLGMMAGGYSDAQIKNPKTRKQVVHDGRGGVFNATVNGHENVFTKRNGNGKKATFVVPPKNSKAYDDYMSVLSGGFIPNFNLAALKRMRKIAQDFQSAKPDKKRGFAGDAKKRQELQEEAREIGFQFGLDKQKTGKPNSTFLNTDKPMRPAQILKGVESRYAKIAQAEEERALVKSGDAAVGPGGEFRGKIHPKTGMIIGKEAQGLRFAGATGDKALQVYDAKNQFGLLGLYGVKETDKGYAEAPIEEISKLKKINELFKNPANKGKHNRLRFGRVGFKNLQYRSMDNEGRIEDNAQKGWFSKELRKEFAGPTERLANAFSSQLLDGRASINIKESGDALFPKGAEGEVFESIINALSRGTSAAFDEGLKEDPNQTWDFKGGGSFGKQFGFKAGNVDGKRTLSTNASKSLVNKIVNTQGGPAQGEVDSLIKALGDKSSKTKKKGRRSAGYIPNFNALFEAVRREKEAGVPAGRIKVGRSDRLRNPSNPSGFGIYNTRDEPMGLTQGINNSVAAGIDPKKKGMARGFVPNFMVDPTVIKERTDWSKGKREEAETAKKSASATKKLTAATQKNTNQAMNTMVWMGLLQQGITGLENAVGEGNNKTQAVISALGSLTSTLMATSYAAGELKEAGMGKLSEAGRRRVNSGDVSLGAALGKRNEAQYRQKRMEARKMGGMRGKMMGGRAMAGRAAGAAGGAAAGMAASGALMGVVAGLAALNAVGKVMTESDFSETFKEARVAGKALEKVKAETEKNISKLNRFGTAAEQAAQTFEDENATMSQVLDASRAMEKEMLKLPHEFRAKLGGIFDPKMVNRMIENMISQEQKNAQTALERKDAADLLEQTRSKGTMDILAHPIDSISSLIQHGDLSGKTDEEKKMDKNLVDDQASRMLTSAIDKNQAQFEGLDTGDLVTRLGAARTAEEKVAIGRELNLSDSDMAIWSKAMHEGGDGAQMLADSMAKAVTQTKAAIKTAEQLRPIREALLKQNKEQLKQIKEAKRQMESDQRIRKAVSKIYIKGAQSFLTEVGKIKLNTAEQVVEARSETAGQFGNVIKLGQSALSEATATTKEEGGLGGTQLGADIRGTFNQALSGGVGSVSESEVEKQTGKLDDMIKKIEKSTSSDDVKAQTQIDQLKDLKKELQNLSGSSERLDKELKTQTKEIMASAAAQKLIAEQQKRLKSFGGPQALLDPSKLNPTFAKITSGGKAMAAAQRAGSKTGFNRGRINQLSGLQDLFGGELPENLQKEGMARATDVGIQQITAINKSMNLGLSKEQIRKTAAEQAANLFKGDPQKMNTKALESVTLAVNTLSDILDHSRRDVVTEGEMFDEYGRQKAERSADYSKTAETVTKANEREADAAYRDFSVAQNIRARGEVGTAGYILRQANPLYAVGTQLGLTDDPTAGDIAKSRYMPTEQLRNSAEFNKGRATDAFHEGNETIKNEAVEDIIKKHGLSPEVNINISATTGSTAPDGTPMPSVASLDAGIQGLEDLRSKVQMLEGGMIDAGLGSSINKQAPVV